MDWIRKLGLGLFSAAVWVVAMVWMCLVATMAVLLLPLVSYKRSHPYIGGPGLAFCVRLTISRLVVQYDPEFDPDRQSVFCQNHVSILDGHVACAAIPHAFCGLMNHWHFWIPGYGWIMRLARGIRVHPGDEGRFAEIARAARDRADYGISILTFPEGHRTLDGKVRRFRRGAFFMARDAGLPVVPIAVRGLYEVNHKGSWLFRPGRIEVFVGPQVETAGLSNGEIGDLARRFEEAIGRCLETGELTLDSEIGSGSARGDGAPEA